MRGLLYVCALFLPCMCLWNMKMYWDTRYCVHTDVFHMIFEMAGYICIASAVQYVRPVAVLSDLEHNVDMFAFCLSVLAGHGLAMIRFVEVLVCVKVLKCPGLYEECFHATLRDMFWVVVPAMFYLAASIYTGIKHFGYSSGSGSDTESTLAHDNDHHRVLAGTASSFYTDATEDDIAAWLCVAGAISWNVVAISTWIYVSARVERRGLDMTKCVSRRGRRNLRLTRVLTVLCLISYLVSRLSIPMNIEYAIHRYGEWYVCVCL